MGKTTDSGDLQRPDDQLDGAEKIALKNEYATPRLVEYGTLAKLTRSGLPGAAEGGMGSMCL
jgi:hypothetical protein